MNKIMLLGLLSIASSFAVIGSDADAETAQLQANDLAAVGLKAIVPMSDASTQTDPIPVKRLSLVDTLTDPNEGEVATFWMEELPEFCFFKPNRSYAYVVSRLTIILDAEEKGIQITWRGNLVTAENYQEMRIKEEDMWVVKKH